MAAPTPTVRGTPAGIKLKDGFSSKVTLGALPTASFWEKKIKPPGLDGGEPIQQTTMHNVTYRTTAPRQLKTLTPQTFTAAYDPNFYNQLLSRVNVEDTITHQFGDGSTLAYYGFLKSIVPNDVEEGAQPEAQIEIVPTNWDYINHVEAAPVLTSVSGT